MKITIDRKTDGVQVEGTLPDCAVEAFAQLLVTYVIEKETEEQADKQDREKVS